MLRRSAVAGFILLLASSAWADNPKPGEIFTIRLEDLPAPNATPSVGMPPRAVKRPAGAGLEVPPGFHATLFAEGLHHARWLAVAPNGDVFLAEPLPGRITLLRDSAGIGQADVISQFAAGFDQPHGMAFHGDYLYVADVQGLWRLPYRPGQTTAAGPPERLTPPGALGDGNGHRTRNIVFSPKGDRLFLADGSRSNIDENPPPRATIQEFAADGSQQRTFASGLRNPVGIAIRPGTDEVWAVVNERDGMGDGLVPDYLTRVRDGGFYGWPYSYLGGHPQPGMAEKRPDLVAKAIVPDLLIALIRRRSAWPSTTAANSPPTIGATPSSPCMARGIRRSRLATWWFAYRSRTASRPAPTRRSPPASASTTALPPKSGVARSAWRWPRTAACWWPTTSARRCGGSATGRRR